MNMKQLPAAQRPYEKAMANGVRSLTDAELLGVILRTGSSGETAVALAERLLRSPGGSGLHVLFHLSLQQLMDIRGIGTVKALQLKCIAELAERISRQKAGEMLCFNDPQSIADYYMEEYRHEEQEKVLLLMLDTKNRLISEQVISMGTVNASLISPREIFLTALKYRAVSVILLHNHPSGNPEPSPEDIELTRRVESCGILLGIRLLDHIIIGDRSSISFRQAHLLTE